MNSTTYSKMNVKQLTALIDELTGLLKTARARDVANLRAAMEALADENGLTLREIIEPPPRVKRAYKKTARRKIHVNPKDPAQKWNGHGRRPSWFVEQQEAK